LDKFMGIGLKKAMMLAIFTMLFIVFAKVILTKYPIPGVSEVVQSV
jgi:hypothetical protein